ncbi:MAG: hypothetical protein HY298_17600 [Verrucomicrobia bacterium]|nr:hypothetical protein [Verrucomicrobiota bacterium]
MNGLVLYTFKPEIPIMSYRSMLQVTISLFVAMQTAAAPVDIYILTGQSNALGTTELEDADCIPGPYPGDASTRIFWSNVNPTNNHYPPILYGDSGGAFVPLQLQQGDGGANPMFWGPEFGFARTLHMAGRTNFVIIKACRGGGGNAYWDKSNFETNSGRGHMWGHLRDTVGTALAALSKEGQAFNVRGFLYIQGESNSSAEAVVADIRLLQLASNLTARINAQYPGAADGMRTVLGEIAASQSNASRQTTTKKQVAAASVDDKIVFVSTRDLPLKSDKLHFGKDAKLEIGKRMAKCFLVGQSKPSSDLLPR